MATTTMAPKDTGQGPAPKKPRPDPREFIAQRTSQHKFQGSQQPGNRCHSHRHERTDRVGRALQLLLQRRQRRPHPGLPVALVHGLQRRLPERVQVDNHQVDDEQHLAIKSSYLEKVWDATSGLPAGPNIVVILSDDYGYGSAGCYGADPTLVRTPNLDRLAREGRRMDNAHVVSTVCTPGGMW